MRQHVAVQLRAQFQPAHLQHLPVVIVIGAADYDRMDADARWFASGSVVLPSAQILEPAAVLAVHPADLLLDDAPLTDVIHKTAIEGLSIVPATVDLSSADIDLISNEKRSFLLHDSLRQVAIDGFGLDYILIDCPPSLNILTVNAMVAAHSVLVPLQSEFFALEGLSQLMLTVREVRQSANPSLRIEGVVLTMYDRRNNLSQQVEQDARTNLGDLVFRTVIPRNVRLSEAPSYAMPVLSYDSRSQGAAAYRELAGELLDRHHQAAA